MFTSQGAKGEATGCGDSVRVGRVVGREGEGEGIEGKGQRNTVACGEGVYGVRRGASPMPAHRVWCTRPQAQPPCRFPLGCLGCCRPSLGGTQSPPELGEVRGDHRQKPTVTSRRRRAARRRVSVAVRGPAVAITATLGLARNGCLPDRDGYPVPLDLRVQSKRDALLTDFGGGVCTPSCPPPSPARTPASARMRSSGSGACRPWQTRPEC